MTTTTQTTDVAVLDPQCSDAERYALTAFLAGYRGPTRDAYALDLRHRLRLFAVRRADIECYARDLEERGRARAAVARRLCTVAGRLLPVRGTGGAPRALTRRPRPPAAARPRVPRHRLGSQ